LIFREGPSFRGGLTEWDGNKILEQHPEQFYTSFSALWRFCIVPHGIRCSGVFASGFTWGNPENKKKAPFHPDAKAKGRNGACETGVSEMGQCCFSYVRCACRQAQHIHQHRGKQW